MGEKSNKKTKIKTNDNIRAAIVSIIVNLALSLGKLLAGILGHSMSMVADAAHSASDVFTTVIVIFALLISAREADAEHRYGHERFESVASLVLSFLLLMTGFEIGKAGILSIWKGTYLEASTPTMLPVIAAIVSIVVKEWMFWYTRGVGKRTKSDALMADAWHHRTDALTSVGALVGILFARFGFKLGDPIASILICIFIFASAIEIFRSAVSKLTDQACDKETEEAIRRMIEGRNGVEKIDLLMTRQFGNKIYVDVEIAVDGNQNLWGAHEIAEQVHDDVEREFPDVKHCMIHVNPYLEGK